MINYYQEPSLRALGFLLFSIFRTLEETNDFPVLGLFLLLLLSSQNSDSFSYGRSERNSPGAHLFLKQQQNNINSSQKEFNMIRANI